MKTPTRYDASSSIALGPWSVVKFLPWALILYATSSRLIEAHASDPPQGNARTSVVASDEPAQPATDDAPRRRASHALQRCTSESKSACLCLCGGAKVAACGGPRTPELREEHGYIRLVAQQTGPDATERIVDAANALACESQRPVTVHWQQGKTGKHHDQGYDVDRFRPDGLLGHVAILSPWIYVRQTRSAAADRDAGKGGQRKRRLHPQLRVAGRLRLSPRPLASGEGDADYDAMLFVRMDALGEGGASMCLEMGRRICASSNKSTSSYLYVRTKFMAAYDRDHDEGFLFFGSHDAALSAFDEGLCDAVAIASNEFPASIEQAPCEPYEADALGVAPGPACTCWQIEGRRRSGVAAGGRACGFKLNEKPITSDAVVLVADHLRPIELKKLEGWLEKIVARDEAPIVSATREAYADVIRLDKELREASEPK